MKMHEACVAVVAAAYESLHRESARLRYENDDLKQFNQEHVQTALSTSKKKGWKKFDKTFSSIISGILGIAI